MQPIIEVDNLSKKFELRQKRGWKSRLLGRQTEQTASRIVKIALHPTSFAAVQGETIAFIGPNGAGKSTTIKMLTGILHPTSGDARVLGMRPWEERVRLSYQIGTVFGQKSQLWYHLPPSDTFALMGKVYELSKADLNQRTRDLVERFELGPLMQTPVRKLSLGERMRCEIALSFLHRPKILFLDEPTIGLDVLVKQSIRELIKTRNREEGVTVFLTSHDATDVQSMCERVLVINNGSLLFDGPTAELVKQYLHFKEVRLQFNQDDFSLELNGVEVHVTGKRQATLVVDLSKARVDQVLSEILRRFDIGDLSIVEPSMEDIIRAIYIGAKQPGHSEEVLAT